MIPYDDLVAALTAWRARQGLPVAQSAAAPPAPPAKKTAAPAPAGVASGRPAAARTAAPAADLGDFEDGALVEDASYDAGEDYVMQLGAEQTAESTAISNAPEPTPAGRGKRDKW
jgi:hypothetical protein